MEIHLQLREVRLSKGITQTYVSEKTGISNNKLSRFEKGQQKLYYDEFLKVCKVLEVNPNKFIKEM